MERREEKGRAARCVMLSVCLNGLKCSEFRLVCVRTLPVLGSYVAVTHMVPTLCATWLFLAV